MSDSIKKVVNSFDEATDQPKAFIEKDGRPVRGFELTIRLDDKDKTEVKRTTRDDIAPGRQITDVETQTRGTVVRRKVLFAD